MAVLLSEFMPVLYQNFPDGLVRASFQENHNALFLLRCTKNSASSPLMTRKEKLVERLGNPQQDVGWTIAEVTKVLEIFGFVLARVAGSHHVFRKEKVAGSFVVPVHGNKVKPAYVQEIRERLLNEK